jgi:Family of unknown function (DUF6174)
MVFRMKNTSLIMTLLLNGILVQIAAQGALLPTTKVAEQGKFNKAMNTWNNLNPQFYNYDLVVECAGCANSFYPWEHNVELNMVKGVDSKGRLLSTLSDMRVHFNRIQTAINKPDEHVSVVYDSAYGFPTMFQLANVDAGGAYSNLSVWRIQYFRLVTGSARTMYNHNLALWNRRNVQGHQTYQ